jgi:hypothetical protein
MAVKPLLDLSKSFLQTLPQLARYALSTTHYDFASNYLFGLLQRMFKDVELGRVADDSRRVPKLKVSLWDHVDIHYPSQNRPNSEVMALDCLLQELASVDFQRYDWTGGARDRISFILLLHRFLYGDRCFNEATFNAVLPWAITLSTREWRRTSSTPLLNHPDSDTFSFPCEEEAQVEEEYSQELRLRDFIIWQILRCSPQAIESFCNCIISNELSSLPPSFLSDFGIAVRELLEEEVAPSIENSLDKLFLHFLTRRHGISGTCASNDQQRTLAEIIRIVSDASRARLDNLENTITENLLKKWRSFLRIRSKESEEEAEADVQARPVETGPHHLDEVDGVDERNMAAEDSFAISPAISIPALLQLIEAALDPGAEQDSSTEGSLEE